MFYDSCKYPHLLPHTVIEEHESTVASIASIQSELQTQEAGGDPDESLVVKYRAHLTAFLPLLSEVKAAVEEANERGEQESLLAAAARKLEQEEKGRGERQPKGSPLAHKQGLGEGRSRVEDEVGKLEVQKATITVLPYKGKCAVNYPLLYILCIPSYVLSRHPKMELLHNVRIQITLVLKLCI